MAVVDVDIYINLDIDFHKYFIRIKRIFYKEN